MNFKDRTSEFYNLVDRIKKRGKGLSTGSPVKRQATPVSSRSEFARMAAQLGRSIAATSEKLEQLTYSKMNNREYSQRRVLTCYKNSDQVKEWNK